MLLTQELNGNSLGLVAMNKRNIKEGNEFNRFFAQPQRTDPIMRGGVNPYDTINKLMPDIIGRTRNQTAQISVVLKSTTLESTLHKIWDFVYNHIQYAKDNQFIEQLRHPVRTWADRKTGVDCDCYSIFISTILLNLRIPHTLRMASYSKKRGWQHVYIVVPKFNGANLKVKGQYYTVDCVMNEFNAEKPFIDCYDNTILGGNNESGLNGFCRSIAFHGLSNKVYPNVFYHTGLGTWCLKSLDGSFLVEGNPQIRYVGNTGVDCLDGLFATAITIGGKLIKGVVKKVGNKIVDKVKEKVVSTVSNVKEGAKEVAETAKEAVSEAKQTISDVKQNIVDTGATYVQQFNDLKDVYQQQAQDLRYSINQLQEAVKSGATPEEIEKYIKKANNAAVMATDKTKAAAENAIANSKAATENAIKKSNNATVLSIDKISKEEKAHIDEKFNELEQPLKEIVKSAQTTEELQAEVAKATALAAGGQKLTQDLQKNNKITLYVLIGVAVLVVIMLFKRR